jgi:hypothetical protein
MLTSSNPTEEQKVALMREFYSFMRYRAVGIALMVALCLYMILAEQVDLRLVALGFAATFAIQILTDEISKTRTNRILGTVRSSGWWILLAIQVILYGTVVGMMLFWAP